jgi:hypothetical protein
MGIATDIISKFGVKLSQWQTFIIIVLILAITIIIGSNTFMSQTDNINNQVKTNKQIVLTLEKLTRVVQNQNINNLGYKEACERYYDLFSSSMDEITRLSMNTITYNHIDDSVRQVVIKHAFYTTITNMYKEDYDKLDRLKYNNIRLSFVMDKISPTNVADNVLEIMFNPNLSHTQKRIDIDRYLTGQANIFYQQAKQGLMRRDI